MISNNKSIIFFIIISLEFFSIIDINKSLLSTKFILLCSISKEMQYILGKML